MSVSLNKLIEKFDLEAVEIREYPGMVFYKPISRGIYTNGFFFLSLSQLMKLRLQLMFGPAQEESNLVVGLI